MGTILRLKFWLAMGAVVLAGLALLVIGVLQASNNNELRSDLDDALKKVEGVPEIHNNYHAQQAKKLTAAYAAQRKELEAELSKPDVVLEAPFDDEEHGEKGPLDYGVWRHVYPKMVTKLEERLVNCVDRSSPGLIKSRRVPDYWMKREEMYRWEKEYRLQEALVSVLEAANEGFSLDRRVPDIRSLRITGPSKNVLRDVHKKAFTAMGFEFVSIMHFADVPAFLEETLRNGLQLELTAVHMDRVAKDRGAARRVTEEAAGGEGEGPSLSGATRLRAATGQASLRGPQLRVVVLGYIPDYKQKTAKKTGRGT